ncbi:MAG TPA: nucleotidyltransferase family protein [Paracoccaceae bacterium]|nr:nucleotidyltransferase family protein [Paracoccaceae bacterium]
MSLGTAMVLAAGFGTRMGELTRERPKPLLPVAGRALIDHALDAAAEAGIRRAVVNLHYRGDQIGAHLAGRRAPEVVFSLEPEILDTGGGIARALSLLGDGPFAVLNSDAVFIGPNPIRALLAGWQPDRMDALMLLVPIGRARAYTRAGDFFLAADGATPVRRGEAASAPLVYAGAQILSPAALAGAPEGAFSLNLVWDRLIAAGRLAALAYRGDWVDVGTPQGLAEADRLLARPGA